MSAYTVYSTHIQYTVWQKGFKICIRWRNKKLNKSPDIGQTWSAAWHESYILYVKTKFTKLLYSYFAYSRRCGIAHQTSKEEVTGSYPASPIMIRDAAGKTRRASPWRRKNIFWGNDSNEVAKWSEHRTAGAGVPDLNPAIPPPQVVIQNVKTRNIDISYTVRKFNWWRSMWLNFRPFSSTGLNFTSHIV